MNSDTSKEISPDAQKYLDEIPSTDTIYFTEFMNAFASKQYKYFAFIEGNDKPYYIIPCENILGDDATYFIRCNGKKNVRELIYTIENSRDSMYKNSNFFGIIDQDYALEDEFIFNNKELSRCHLYITPYYSFENFYLNKETFSKILETEFSITKYGRFSSDYTFNMQNFEDRLFEFIQLIINVDKKYRAYQISKINSEQNMSNYRSNDIKLNNAIDINIKSICLKTGKNIDDCFKSSQYNIDDYISDEALSQSQQHYQHNNAWDYCKTIRGKFMMWFLVNYLKSLKDDLNSDNLFCFSNRKQLKLKNNDSITKNTFHKCKLEINIDNACSVLAQYAEQPQCLIKFLHDVKAKGIVSR